jgi:osmotically-inducible protein OsmY
LSEEFGLSHPCRRFCRLIPLALPIALSGCLVVAAAGTGSSIGYVATEDRSLRQNADDIVACTQAIQLWAQFNTQLNDDLSCHTYEGRMLVTGNVPSAEWRDEAIKRAWRAKNVTQVYDEITIGPGEGLMKDAHDALTTQKLKAELLADPDVHSNNYIITTENRVVYIIGSAHSEAEKQRVLDRARAMAGVKRVVGFITLDNATASPASAGATGSTGVAPPSALPPPSAAPAPASPPPSPPPAASPAPGAPASNSAVTVTPLH